MAWALLLTNVFVVLLAARLRCAGQGLPYASPAPMGPQVWWWVIAGTGLAAIVAGVSGGKALREAKRRTAAVELLAVFAALFACEWGALPAEPRHYRPADYVVVAALVGLLGFLFWRDRRNFSGWGLTLRNFLPALRLLAIPTAVMIAVPVVARQFMGGRVAPARLLIALGLYPFYALAQLLVFQVFLVQRLRRITDSAVTIVLVSAGTFALLHWPNGVLMAACAPAAAVWTLVYLKRPNLYALAISMGLAAAVLANVLPRDRVLHNLRTGPIYVERQIEFENIRQWQARQTPQSRPEHTPGAGNAGGPR